MYTYVRPLGCDRHPGLNSLWGEGGGGGGYTVADVSQDRGSPSGLTADPVTEVPALGSVLSPLAWTTVHDQQQRGR